MSFFNATIKTNEITLDNELIFPSITEPTTTTNKLYNADGGLKWNGNFITGGVNNIVSISSTSHTSIPSGTMGINIKLVGAGGGGGGQGTNAGDVGGAGSSGSYTEVFLNPSTFDTNTYGSNRSNIYVSIGSGGSAGSGTTNGSDGTNTTIRFSDGSITNGTLIATAIGGFGGYDAGSSSLTTRASIYDGFGGTNTITGTISTGFGYTIPGRPGFNGNIAGTTINNRCGSYGGNSILGSAGNGGNEVSVSGIAGSKGGGGGGGFYDANQNNGGTVGGDGYAIITFY